MLNGNRLSGDIPNFNLPNLQILDLGSNQLSGNIPNFTLPNLQTLYLDKNQLSGNTPNFTLPYLQKLFLGYNQLSGSMTNWSTMSSLASISVSSTKLVFRHLEPAALALQGKNNPSFQYTPQDTIPPLFVLPARTGDPAGSAVLAVSVGGTRTQYRWFKGNAEVKFGSDSTLTLAAGENPSGYRCEMTNPLLPGLILRSGAVQALTSVHDASAASASAGVVSNGVLSDVAVHPNPSSGTGTLRYRLATQARLRIAVYSVLGQHLATVWEGIQSAGDHTQAIDVAGSTGTYMVRVEADGDGRSVQRVQTVPMRLVR